ncbi:MAG TPA: hypothetical protein VMJ10_25630 [Kofleriaceae bacterium]|nr:hypothetical protein [Kofleriaceae bacterium]
MRVSSIVKLAAVVAVIAIAAWLLLRRHHAGADVASSPGPSPSPMSSGSPPTATATSTSPSGAPTHVTQLSPEQRQRVADKIASYRARSGARGPRPELPTGGPPTEDPPMADLKTSIHAAMGEVVPYLTACYEKALPTLANPHLEVTAYLTLTGDRDVGTLIDADRLVDNAGQPLPRNLDDCLRSTLMTLQLPALVEGDVVTVHYPFVFDTNPP